jgi:hypothetical protein
MEIEMYVIETHREKVSGRAMYQCLHEATQREISDWLEYFKSESEAASDKYREFIIVPWQKAHRWVRDGRLHNTALYVENNFIRKAKCLD